MYNILDYDTFIESADTTATLANTSGMGDVVAPTPDGSSPDGSDIFPELGLYTRDAATLNYSFNNYVTTKYRKRSHLMRNSQGLNVRI